MRREFGDPRNRAPSMAQEQRTLARCVPVKTRSSSEIRVANAGSPNLSDYVNERR